MIVDFAQHINALDTLRAARDAIGAAAALESCGCRVTGAHAHGARAVVCIDRPPPFLTATTLRPLGFEIESIGRRYGVHIEARR